MNTATADALLLRLPEAAARLAVSRSALYEMIGRGELPVVKMGRSVRVPAEALTAFVARLCEGGGAAHV